MIWESTKSSTILYFFINTTFQIMIKYRLQTEQRERSSRRVPAFDMERLHAQDPCVRDDVAAS